MTRATSPPEHLADAGPAVGQVLVISRDEWRVASHATYRSGEGYHVDEWECRKGTANAYLLKETEPTGVRWFFTDQIALSAVTLAGGEPLDHWRGRVREGDPPPSLLFRGQTYGYDTTTEGSYEEIPGRAVGKTTWEYWDAPRTHNLAVERWPDGRLEAYHGAYVDAGTITVRPGQQQVPAVLAAVIVAAFVYFIVLMMGLPFDRCTGISLVIASIVGLARSLYRTPSAALAGLVLAPLLGLVFLRFPPLTTLAGVAAFIIAPALMSRWAARETSTPHPAVRSAAFFTVALPALIVGLYYYFWFAPGPHTLGQYVLALGPALVGGVAAAVVAGLMRRASG